MDALDVFLLFTHMTLLITVLVLKLISFFFSVILFIYLFFWLGVSRDVLKFTELGAKINPRIWVQHE